MPVVGSRRPAAALATLLAVALGVGACGGESEAAGGATSAPEATGVGQVRAGSVASLAQCSDWNAGSEAERLATIADIRGQVNQAGADGPTPDLNDDDASALFERACANDYAAGFRLYKLYLRAASFSALGG